MKHVSYPFVQAKNYTKVSGTRQTDLVVMHLMVIAEIDDAAERVASYFAGANAPQASAHLCIDNNSIVRGVRDNDVAWAAPGANADGLQLEQAGTLQTPQQWQDDYSKAMLRNSADAAAQSCKEHGIPAKWRTPAELKANKRGITDHWRVNQAFQQSTHTDCGVNYPYVRFIDMVRERLDSDHDKHVDDEKKPFATIQLGDERWEVKRAEKLLRLHGFHVVRKPDTTFDEFTERAVRNFQKSIGISADGVVGPKTWRALRAA